MGRSWRQTEVTDRKQNRLYRIGFWIWKGIEFDRSSPGEEYLERMDIACENARLSSCCWRSIMRRNDVQVVGMTKLEGTVCNCSVFPACDQPTWPTNTQFRSPPLRSRYRSLFRIVGLQRTAIDEISRLTSVRLTTEKTKYKQWVDYTLTRACRPSTPMSAIAWIRVTFGELQLITLIS